MIEIGLILCWPTALCSFMMEYDIHTILDGLTLLATFGVLYALWFTPIKNTYQGDLDSIKFYYVVSITHQHSPSSIWQPIAV